ncbi:MAG TPA: preprotein translocase subunit SecG [Bacteroidia bacterium]|nr:preprotein translocase subunit SecG [Bacteroidia bacterium]
MELILEILTVIVCILLILVVLVQDSKGGGLSSSFGGSNQILGVRRTTDFLEKATWVLAIALLVFSLASSFFAGTSSSSTQGISSTKDKASEMNVPQPQQQQRPSAPAATPAPAPKTP